MNSEEEWISVTNNKKLKKNKTDHKQYNNKKYNKEREFDKSKVKLWYDNNSWQHNILIDNYEYEDNSSVMSKFELEDLVELYKKADTNYDKNNIVRKLTKRLNDEKWKEISVNVRKKNNNISEKEELKLSSEIEEHVIDNSDIVLMNDPLNLEDQNVVMVSSRTVDKNISFASMLKQKN
jgi:hypothetical protein